MLERMLVYRAYLYSKHKLPVKQFVFYFGENPCRMAYGLKQENLDFS